MDTVQKIEIMSSALFQITLTKALYLVPLALITFAMIFVVLSYTGKRLARINQRLIIDLTNRYPLIFMATVSLIIAENYVNRFGITDNELIRLLEAEPLTFEDYPFTEQMYSENKVSIGFSIDTLRARIDRLETNPRISELLERNIAIRGI